MTFLYVVKSEEEEYYIGCTEDLEKRLSEHNSGRSKYTSGKQWRLVYYEAYLSKKFAYERERALKHNRRMNMFLLDRVKKSLGMLE